MVSVLGTSDWEVCVPLLTGAWHFNLSLSPIHPEFEINKLKQTKRWEGRGNPVMDKL